MEDDIEVQEVVDLTNKRRKTVRELAYNRRLHAFKQHAQNFPVQDQQTYSKIGIDVLSLKRSLKEFYDMEPKSKQQISNTMSLIDDIIEKMLNTTNIQECRRLLDSARNYGRGVKDAVESSKRREALQLMHDNARREDTNVLLTDQGYQNARSLSMVNALNPLNSMYLPQINPETSNQLLVERAMRNPSLMMPDGNSIQPFGGVPQQYASFRSQNNNSLNEKHLNKLVDMAMSTADPVNIPIELNCDQLEHQRQGLGWLLSAEKHNKGGILADEMGLGKTLQTIALLYANKPSPELQVKERLTLIVCPVALLETWRTELKERVKPNFRKRVYVHHRQSNSSFTTNANTISMNYDVVLCTYGAIAREFKNLNTNQPHPLYKIKWFRIVLDEAHAIKNLDSKTSIAATKLNSINRIALSGTPMQNSLNELYPLIRFLKIRPYNELMQFKRATLDTKLFTSLLRSVMFRRKKDTKINGRSILDGLPKKEVNTLKIKMKQDEREVYMHLESNIRQEVGRLSSTETSTFGNMLTLLLRMRQSACHPKLVDITKRLNESHVFGNNKETKSMASRVINMVKMMSEDQLIRAKSERACAMCSDTDNIRHLIHCGHLLCEECGAEADREESMNCPQCSVVYTSTAPYEIFDIVKNMDNPHTDLVVNILLERQRPLLVEMRRQEAERESNLQMLQFKADEKTFLNFDEDDAVVVDPMEFKINIDEVAKLSKLSMEFQNGWESSAKIDQCIELLRQIWTSNPSDKVILFTSFVSLLKVMTIPLDAARVPYEFYTGAMSATERTKSLENFRHGQAKILLTSLKAGNVGLTLTEANHVIIMEPFWNPYVEDQAQDRVHRIGQSREVFVYKLFVEESVEDRIFKLQDEKKNVIESALEGSSNRAATLSRSDLMFAFGLTRGRFEETIE